MIGQRKEISYSGRPESTIFWGWWKGIGILCLALAAAVASPAQTFTTLVNFNGTNGSQPSYMSLTQGLDGSLFGTTSGDTAFSMNTIFKMKLDGALTTIYSFSDDPGSGQYGLTLATNGTFYGTTQSGGTYGYGSVFSITPTGILNTVYSFTGGADGFNPECTLVQGADGNFYGTTFQGGTYEYYGTVFRMTQAGILNTLYSFNDGDGSGPQGGLIKGTDGDFYGTTMNGINFWGTVYKITPNGKLTTLHSFCTTVGCPDGEQPQGGVVQGSDGNFYGATLAGGAYGGGTIFRVSSAGSFTTIYNFCGQINCPDGSSPGAGLVEGTDGNFYGTTFYGGSSFQGTAFEVTPSGTETVLHNFCSLSNCADGQYPVGGLVQDTNGMFYGTTDFGGAYNEGTVFSLSVGLGPFVKTLPTSGRVGEIIAILGNKLTSATNVTFNGVDAAFNVNSTGTAIFTTVPTASTTGFVTVTTPSGTLRSNVKFRVRP